MSRRGEVRIAWGLCVFAVLLLPPAMWLLYLSAGAYHTNDLVQAIVQTPLQLIIPALGALIVTRRPGNVIGWLLCVLGVLLAFGEVTEAYAVYAITIHPLYGSIWIAWFSHILPFPVEVSILTFPFLVFPDGKLVSRRWRPVVWLTAGFVLAIALHEAAVPVTIEVLGPNIVVHNPIHLAFAAGLFRWLDPLAFLVAPVAILAPLLALVTRYRRAKANSPVRQQIKLIGYVVAISAACFVLSDPALYGASQAGSAISDTFWYLFNASLTLGLPVAVVIAVLRHGLWNIDRIINRTLVYISLTTSLGAVYVLGVLSLQYLLAPITHRSDLAVALSTLVVAALFQPIRHRIQAFVDHRFFRRKYDEQRILTSFSIAARDEVDLERLANALTFAIDEAMQPAHVAVWLPEVETS